MLATPIVNPIVLLSTYNAFPTMPLMMPLRAACGLVGAIAIGALVGSFKNSDACLKRELRLRAVAANIAIFTRTETKAIRSQSAIFSGKCFIIQTPNCKASALT